jgi:nicotinamide-nucleotide amidase
MAKAIIITIGDELLIGQIINTNAAWLGAELTNIGVEVVRHLVISDNPNDIFNSIKKSLTESDIVITTGGLGPTVDDRTKQTICDVFEDKLVFHQPSFDNIIRLFKIRNREVTERNRLQAYIPSKTTALTNLYGTAPGIMFNENGKVFFATPGVPIEMKSLVKNSIAPILQDYIQTNNQPVVLYRTFNAVNIFETQLESLISDVNILLDADSSIAFLPNYNGVRLRFGTRKSTFELAKEKLEEYAKVVYKKASDFIISEGDYNLIAEVANLLIKHKKNVAVAESCTGGGLGFEFTKLPGSSAYFVGGVIAYSNEIKMKVLNVSSETLNNYGAVSEQTASEMANNVRHLFNTDFGVSITGIAGPDGGSPEKPVGTICFGISSKSFTHTFTFNFGEHRDVNRYRSIEKAILLLIDELNTLN